MKRTLTRLGVSALALTSAAGVLAAPTAAQAQTPSRPSQAKNIILLIGDGMGTTHVTAARTRYAGAAGKLAMQTLPVTGQVSTYAVEEDSTRPDLVTDSASAATAWASGVKTYNNAIGVDAFGKEVVTLMEQAKAAGMRTGNVATAEITDATPAAMMSHTLLRGCQGPTFTAASCQGSKPVPSNAKLITPIAEQIARNNVADVILGGGLSRFEPDDEAAMRSNGYQVLGSFGAAGTTVQTAATQRVATRSDLAGVTSGKVIGLFNRGNMTIETSKATLPTGAAEKAEPNLAEMTTKAVDLLKGTDKGFLLQIEGALIDKRGHANDANQVLGEMKAFDDAVKAAKDFAAADGNTLVITTADHENAGFNIIAKGSFNNAEAAAPPGNVDSGNTANNGTPLRQQRDNVRDPNRSNGIVNGTSVRPAPSGSATPTTGLYGSADPKNFAPATFRTLDDPPGIVDGSPEASLWLSFLNGNHTGADVPLFASGPESSRFSGQQENTDLYFDMFKALRALGNENSSPAPAVAPGKPVVFRAIVQGRGNGAVIVAVNDVGAAQPGAQVVVYYKAGNSLRFVRNLKLNAQGRTTLAPASFRFARGTQQTFVIEVRPSDGRSAVTRSQPVTTYVG